MRKIIFLLCYCVYFFTYAQKWEMKQAPLMTPWSKNIDIHHVLPEYPRPLMQREDWKNLLSSTYKCNFLGADNKQ